MRALFASFDNFMMGFVGWLAVTVSSLFMSMAGGPLQPYEAQALGIGLNSLRTGEASTVNDAFDIMTALPAETRLPRGHVPAPEAHLVLADFAAESDMSDLLGGPLEWDEPGLEFTVLRPNSRARVVQIATQPPAAPDQEPAAPACDLAAIKVKDCTVEASVTDEPNAATEAA